MDLLLGLLFFAQLFRDPLALVGGQPFRLAGPVGEVEDGNDAKYDRRNSFQDEQPSPAPQTEPTDTQQPTRQGRTKNERDGISGIEKSDHLGAILRAEPVG